MQQEYPEAVVRFLKQYHADGVTEADCRACSSPCCSLGGFAILENVVQIYALYQRGQLRRADYEYEPGLSFEAFVFKYFEVYKKAVPVDGRELVLMLFHMRCLSSDDHLIAIPAVGDYWETRAELFRENPWLNRGCVFLSHKAQNWPHDDGDASRHCVLHAPQSGRRITTKPVDCVFFTCNRPIEARVPTEEQSSAWFRLLAESFPNSLERFEELIGQGRPDTDEAASSEPHDRRQAISGGGFGAESPSPVAGTSKTERRGDDERSTLEALAAPDKGLRGSNLRNRAQVEPG